MNSSNNKMTILLKASLLATVIFWTLVLLSEKFHDAFFTIAIIIISIIPISIVCSLAVLFTIVPFFLFEKKDLNSREMFQKYFPYYSVIIFCISSYFMISSNFDNSVCIFFITAFFTLIQSWIWICKLLFLKKINLQMNNIRHKITYKQHKYYSGIICFEKNKNGRIVS